MLSLKPAAAPSALSWLLQPCSASRQLEQGCPSFPGHAPTLLRLRVEALWLPKKLRDLAWLPGLSWGGGWRQSPWEDARPLLGPKDASCELPARRLCQVRAASGSPSGVEYLHLPTGVKAFLPRSAPRSPVQKRGCVCSHTSVKLSPALPFSLSPSATPWSDAQLFMTYYWIES